MINNILKLENFVSSKDKANLSCKSAFSLKAFGIEPVSLFPVKLLKKETKDVKKILRYITSQSEHECYKIISGSYRDFKLGRSAKNSGNCPVNSLSDKSLYEC